MISFIETLCNVIVDLLKAIFSFLFTILGHRDNDRLYQHTSMRFFERLRLFSRFNKGLILNGKRKTLSVKNSLTHTFLVGKSGIGKDSIYFLGNLLQPKNRSFVTVDVDGNLFRETSGYLASLGYDIQIFDLTNIERSSFYNCLEFCENDDDVKRLAEQIMVSSSAHSRSSDSFWQYSATSLLFLLFRIVMTQKKEHQNLANVRHLLTLIELDEFHEFVSKNCAKNPTIWNDYLSFKSKDKKLRTNIEATLSATLDLFSYQEINHITSHNTIDFERLKRPKSIIYVIVAERKIRQHSLLIATFFSQLLDYLQRYKSKNPIYFMLNEAGAYQIKDLDILSAILRRYRISLSIAVQDIAMLKQLYGEHAFSTIFSNMGTKIIYPSTSLALAENISKTAGQKSVEIVFEGKKQQQVKPVLTPTEIIQMKKHHCLVHHSNKPPIMMRTYQYFKQYRLKKRSRITPIVLPETPITTPPLIPIISQTNTTYEGFDTAEFTAENL